jgi:hypothetical protein
VQADISAFEQHPCCETEICSVAFERHAPTFDRHIMMKNLLAPSRVMSKDSHTTNIVYWMISGLVAVAMLLCASGSGNPATAHPLPDWVNSSVNIFNVVIAIFVLIPRTRAGAAVLAALNMIASMYTNYAVDGYDYFIKVLAFDLGSLIVSVIVVAHYWRDLFPSAKQNNL